MSKKTPYDETPGNTIMSQAASDRYAYDVGCAVLDVDFAARKMFEDDGCCKSIRFRAPEFVRGEWLAVVTKRDAEGDVVAFVSAPDLVDCVKALGAKLRNGTMSWKEDQYAGQ